MQSKKNFLHLNGKSKSAPILIVNTSKEKYQRRAWSSLPTTCLFDTNLLKQKKVNFTNSEIETLPRKLSMTTEKSIDIGFTAYPNTLVHQHNHLRRPHMHEKDCDRLTSGFDKNREKRFYFTCQLTPVRVYINYDKVSSSIDRRLPNEKLDEFNCRQLSPTCLKSKIGLSQKFIKDASEYFFLTETLSFVPLLSEEQIQMLRQKKHLIKVRNDGLTSKDKLKHRRKK